MAQNANIDFVQGCTPGEHEEGC